MENTRRCTEGAWCDTGTGSHHRRRRSRLQSVCREQGESLRRTGPAFRTHRSARRHQRSDAAGQDRRIEQRPEDTRHPGATAGAEAHRQQQGAGSDQPGQGRGWLPSDERRRAGHRQHALCPLHPLWRDETAGEMRGNHRGQTRRGGRAQQHRRQTDGADAAATNATVTICTSKP